MHQASVGVHCPECVKGNKQKVFTSSNLPGQTPIVTNALIAINVAVFLVQLAVWNTRTSIGSGFEAALELATYAPFINSGEWWLVFTSGFGHYGIFHLLMNMYSLYVLGPMLERRLGSVRFGLAYMAALVGGSVGALVAEPLALSMGASGAIFGLLGLVVMIYRSQGASVMQSQLGPVLLLNGFISFSGYVSLGGHAGGFIVGLALGALYFGTSPRSGPAFGRDQVKPNLVTAAAIVVLFLAAIAVAAAAPII